MAVDTTPSASYRHGLAGYGASQPHVSLHSFHDSDSFVAACAAAFGAPEDNPAPASPSVDTQAADGSLDSQVNQLMEIGSAVPEVRAQRAPPAEQSLDLIEGHKSREQNTRVLLKTECYPTGAVRVVIRQVELDADPIIKGGSPNRTKREKTEQERVDSSVQRTKKTIRQRAMAFRVDRLLTLTYRENMDDRARCYADVTRFIQKCQAVNLIPRYIAVPELQKRGAWHVHIAIRGYMPVLTLRRIWREIVGQDNGNIDISYRKRGGNNPWRIASYLAKYIGKSVAQAAPGERTFWASEWNHLAPICRAVLLSPRFAFTQVIEAVARNLSRKQDQGTVKDQDLWMPTRSATAPPGYQPPCILWAA